MSMTFLEKTTNSLGAAFCIVQQAMRPADPANDPKVRRRLRDYVAYWMTQNGWLKIKQMEARARRLGTIKGVSDATVGNILSEKGTEPGIYTLRNIAITLGRPPEEMFLIAIGQTPEKKSNGELPEISSLAEIYKSLTNEQDKVYLTRQIRAIVRDMSATE